MWFRSICLDGDGGDGGGAPSTPPMIRVSHNGTEIEVPKPAGVFTADELKQKYVAASTHNYEMGRMRTQLDAVKGHRNPAELLEDAEFKATAMSAWGLEPGKTQAQFAEQLERQKKEHHAREVEPRERKISELTSTVERYRDRSRDNAILSAAIEAGVDEKFLKSPTKGGTPLIVSMLRDVFAHDAQTDDWYAKGSNGTPFAFSQSGDTPYMTPKEFVAGWVAGEGKDYAKSQRQEGAESRPAAGVPGQVGKELRLTRDQIRHITYFRKMQEKATKEGLTIVPI